MGGSREGTEKGGGLKLAQRGKKKAHVEKIEVTPYRKRGPQKPKKPKRKPKASTSPG